MMANHSKAMMMSCRSRKLGSCSCGIDGALHPSFYSVGRQVMKEEQIQKDRPLSDASIGSGRGRLARRFRVRSKGAAVYSSLRLRASRKDAMDTRDIVASASATGIANTPDLDVANASSPGQVIAAKAQVDPFVLEEVSGQGTLRIFSGTGHETLAQEVAQYMGLSLGKIKIKRFADGEIYVQLQESIRGCDVFLMQPTCPPTNEYLMELLVMIDACRRASAGTITAVIPYFGYARADRKVNGRESIAAKLVANLLTTAGCDRVLVLDLHSSQCVGYFDIPVDHVYGQSVVLDYLSSKRVSPGDLVVVSPDVGGVARARAFAKRLSDAPLAIVDKRRQDHNRAEVMNLIGDVNGKVAVMVDDMIDTAGTISAGAKLLREQGAREVIATATHAVFSPPAIERLSSGLFTEVIVTNR